MKYQSIVILCLLALAASGCDAIAALIAPETAPDMPPTAVAEPLDTATPDTVLQRWFEAALAADMDTLEANTCATSQSILQKAADSFSALEVEGSELALSEVTYTVSEMTGETATVTIGGSIRVSLGDETASAPLGNIPVALMLEAGAWKVCGL